MLAALAGALAVVGAWEALAAVEGAAVARALGRVLAPLRAAGQRGRTPSAPERRRLGVVGALTLLGGGWLIAGPLLGAGAAAAGPWLVGAIVAARRRRWRARLAAGAPAVARALADALGAGHSVRGGIGMVAHGGLGDPAAGVLGDAAHDLALGERTEDVLERVRRRAGDPAWDTMVAAILLQREAGGDLAGLLRTIAATGEEASRAMADARTVTAQARFTAWLVAGLPAGAALLAELAAPGYLLGLAGSPITGLALGGAIAGQALALVLIGRIARGVSGP